MVNNSGALQVVLATIFAQTVPQMLVYGVRLLDLSEKAYNITVYYEKYGLSARTRYTWREAYPFRRFWQCFQLPLGFSRYSGDRGQLNASVSYAVNDNLNVGVEAVNLTESDVTQYCVNEDALLCYQGLTDRRVTFGASYRF